MNIEEYVKNNKTYNILNRSAIIKAQKLIESNEEVLYALVTNISISPKTDTSFRNQKNFFGGAMQIKNTLSGVIVITNKRIIFCNSVIGTTNEKQLRIEDIQSIDEHISVFKTGELRVNGITETFIIKILRKDLNEEIKKAINKARNEQKNNNISSTISNADEIRKYKQLCEDGIITNEEFERKKAELLK